MAAPVHSTVQGFDTRGTEYAGPRLAWAQLQPSLLQGSRVVVDINHDHSNSNPSSNDSNTTRSRNRRSWADDLIASFSSVACYDEPIPASKCLRIKLYS